MGDLFCKPGDEVGAVALFIGVFSGVVVGGAIVEHAVEESSPFDASFRWRPAGWPLASLSPSTRMWARALMARGASIVQRALSKRWLEEQGVPELQSIWIGLHYGESSNARPVRTRTPGGVGAGAG